MKACRDAVRRDLWPAPKRRPWSVYRGAVLSKEVRTPLSGGALSWSMRGRGTFSADHADDRGHTPLDESHRRFDHIPSIAPFLDCWRTGLRLTSNRRLTQQTLFPTARWRPRHAPLGKLCAGPSAARRFGCFNFCGCRRLAHAAFAPRILAMRRARISTSARVSTSTLE